MSGDLDDRPEQFKAISDRLHAEWESRREEFQDWEPSDVVDIRDLRDPSTVGREILRMESLGRHLEEQAKATLEIVRQRELIDEWAS